MPSSVSPAVTKGRLPPILSSPFKRFPLVDLPKSVSRLNFFHFIELNLSRADSSSAVSCVSFSPETERYASSSSIRSASSSSIRSASSSSIKLSINSKSMESHFVGSIITCSFNTSTLNLELPQENFEKAIFIDARKNWAFFLLNL